MNALAEAPQQALQHTRREHEVGVNFCSAIVALTEHNASLRQRLHYTRKYASLDN